LTLHKGKETLLTGALMAESFDSNADDDLYRWSDRRSGYLAKANISSANSLVGSNSSYGGFAGLGLGMGGGFGGNCFGGSSAGYLGYGGYSPWQFNPMFGMYTYVPCNGFAYSPFGYGFYSPYTVGQAPIYGGGGGGIGGNRIPNPSRTGTGSGKHAAFIPARGTSASYRGPSGGYSGGGAVRGSSVSSGSVSSGSVGMSSGGGHASGGGASGGHGH
jgi:hypothetical protein